jgi:hypothetical protein
MKKTLRLATVIAVLLTPVGVYAAGAGAVSGGGYCVDDRRVAARPFDQPS